MDKMPTYSELQKELRKAQLYGSAIAHISKPIMTKDNIEEAIRLLEALQELL